MNKIKHHRRLLASVIAVLMAMTVLAGCGKRESKESPAEAYSGYNDYAAEESAEVYAEGAADSGAAYDTAATSDVSTENIENNGRKMIISVNLDIKTDHFTDLNDDLNSTVTEMGGYIEYSYIDGSNESDKTRYGNYTVRVPEDRLEEFLEYIKADNKITNESRSVQDVTLQYTDMESHVAALETEYDALLELMEKADAVEDIITIQNELTNIRYELEFYQSQLKVYDNQINYSTVNLYIQEEGSIISPGHRSHAGTFFIALLIVVVIVILFILACTIHYTSKKKKGTLSTDKAPAAEKIPVQAQVQEQDNVEGNADGSESINKE